MRSNSTRPRSGGLTRALVLGLVASAIPGSANAQSTDALLERASDRYASFGSLCADFVQRLHVPLLSQTTESRGRLCQMSPNFFRMDFADPEGDMVVADGEFLWLYYPSTQPGQVVQTDLSTRGAIDFHAEFLSEPTTRYDVHSEGRETVQGRATERIRLEPRETVSYRGARVWIDVENALVRRVEIEQEGGSVRWLELSALEIDPGLEASDFRFDVPEGIHVVRMAVP